MMSGTWLRCSPPATQARSVPDQVRALPSVPVTHLLGAFPRRHAGTVGGAGHEVLQHSQPSASTPRTEPQLTTAALGVVAGLLTLAVIVAAMRPGLTLLPLNALRLVVGRLLLVFALGWLR